MELHQKPELSLSMYPNPVENELNLDFGTSLTGSASLQVFDISGKLLINQTIEEGTSTHQINTSSLDRGSYILRLEYASGETERLQFLKP